jgi:effector-binding domain-containing protein
MSKRTKVVLIAVPIVIVAAAVLLFTMGGPNPAQFEYLREPQVRILPDQRVLQVEVKGEPEVVGSQAFGLLFKTYFKLKGVPKGPRQPAPRARWPLSLDTPKDQWIGRYAMPVPESVDSLPSQEVSESGLHATITTWQYGDVAELLHVGPYDREEPTITKLTRFIKECRYEVVGEHEEEYIKGPGMFSKGNPDKYLTIIRYRVRKAK